MRFNLVIETNRDKCHYCSILPAIGRVIHRTIESTCLTCFIRLLLKAEPCQDDEMELDSRSHFNYRIFKSSDPRCQICGKTTQLMTEKNQDKGCLHCLTKNLVYEVREIQTMNELEQFSV